MKLKTYMKKALNGDVTDFKERIGQTRDSLKILDRTDVDNATYFVCLISYWTDGFSAPLKGEKNVKLKHEGTLKDAIKKAEKRFMAINHRDDVQGSYDVSMLLGETKYDVPERYWMRYIRKR